MNLTPENQALWDASEKAARALKGTEPWSYVAITKFRELSTPERIQAILTELSELKARAEAAEAQVKAHLEELERLRATVAKIASQNIGDEIGDEEARSNADYELAYEECVRAARSIRTAKERQAAVTPDEDDIANLEFARDTLRLFIGTHASKMVTLKSAASTAAWRLTATLEHLRKPQGGK